MISSQDYNGGNFPGSHQKDKQAISSKLEKIQFPKNEALNSSIGNIKMTELSNAYGMNETNPMIEDHHRR
jgi:hypothetical protein